MRDTELTMRALVLGAVIAVVFTAANVYLGLHVGLTIASSIPAAVISMGVLRAFNTGTIRENNIVQTVASAGGTLSAIIFVLPGLVMIGWWRSFPPVTTFLVCALGGVLGVLFSIPLRRALVVNSPLPFPEGVAAAEVLKVGARADEAPEDVVERTRGPQVLLVGALLAAGQQLLTFLGLAASGASTYFRVGAAATGLNIGFGPALIGAGHLVGLSVGVAMLVGAIIAWGVATPILSAGLPGTAQEAAQQAWSQQVRFIGAGAIGVAAIWSLVKLVGPVTAGIVATLRAPKAAAAADARADRDIPLGWIGALSVLCLVLIGWVLLDFIGDGPLAPVAWPLVIGGVVLTVLLGVFTATVAGYMAGLIGASNSPVSGIGILSAVAASLLLALLVQPALQDAPANALVAFALFAVSIVFSIATISNDNLQDLKTGQLVGASPMRQQIALIVGVLAGSAVIGPMLNMLNYSFGFPGDPNRVAIAAEPLNAPQATLISALARGVLNADLDWRFIGIGGLAGLAIILVDELLGRAKLMRLPPLAIGIGIYLPMAVTVPVFLGAVLGRLYDTSVAKRADGAMLKRFGLLLAAGFIVGESLIGVAHAGIIAATGVETPLAVVGAGFAPAALWTGAALFALVLLAGYFWTGRSTAQKLRSA
jgi:putative OPT family oligopeptide transporter